MAEAIAIGASVIAIIQISDRIIRFCKSYIETARDAPSDLKTIFIEISALKTTVESLEYLWKHDSTNSAIAKNICSPNGPIKGCHQTLAALGKLFPDGEAKSSEPRENKRVKLDLIVKSLAWPLKETRARKLLDELMRYKTTINLAMTAGIAQDVRCIKEKTLGIHDIVTGSQSREVYTWLQHTDPSSLHQRACKNYEHGTGKWIWQNPQWTEWLARKYRALHVHGIPGAGKTVLMSYLIEQLREHCEQSANGHCVYVYYYCYFAHKQDETKPLLKWLVSRLCREAGGIPKYVSDLSRHSAEPSIADLLEAVARLLSSFETVFVAIDAIDESQPYNELLDIIHTVATDVKFQRLQIITSGRQYRDLQQAMQSFSQLISMSNPVIEQDIRHYVRSTLQRDPHFRKWPQDLLNEVRESLATGASGMFRWAVCQIDIIRRLKYERAIIQMALKTLPKTLYETYDRIVQNIPEEDRTFVYYALQWISFRNEVPLGDAFPYRALVGAAEASMLRLTGSKNMRLYDRDGLADVCGCLVNIGSVKSFEGWSESDKIGDLNDGVTFAHYSVQEYLDSNLDLSSIFGHSTLIGEELRSHLLDITLTESHRLSEDELSSIYSRLEQNVFHPSPAIFHSCLDFRIYSMSLASMSLYRLLDHICHSEVLKALTIDFLNPSNPHYPIMEKLNHSLVARRSDSEADRFGLGHTYLIWDIDWDPSTDTDMKHLGNLLFLAQDRRERLSLVKSLLHSKGCKSLLQTQAHFFIEFKRHTIAHDYRFRGSFIEVFAQLAFDFPNTFKFLMEISADLFDPSIVLVHYVGGFNRDIDRDHRPHPVQRLLELGADPNLKDYKVTPLQIASISGDWKGAQELLRAGAEPNDTGASGGIMWEYGHRMHEFDDFHGASPLKLWRHFGRGQGGAPEREWQKTKELFRSCGAKDFVLPSCKVNFATGCRVFRFLHRLMYLNIEVDISQLRRI